MLSNRRVGFYLPQLKKKKRGEGGRGKPNYSWWFVREQMRAGRSAVRAKNLKRETEVTLHRGKRVPGNVGEGTHVAHEK